MGNTIKLETFKIPSRILLGLNNLWKNNPRGILLPNSRFSNCLQSRHCKKKIWKAPYLGCCSVSCLIGCHIGNSSVITMAFEDWWLIDDWLMIDWWLIDDWLMVDWWLIDDWWWLINDWLMIDWVKIDWRLLDDWLIIDWWLINDWWLIDDWWLMIDWWLIDDW